MKVQHAREEAGSRPRRWLGGVVALAALVVLAVWRPLAPASESMHEFVGPTMGTTYSVTVDADLTVEEKDRVRRAVEMQLDRVNTSMST